ncbi:LOW QUALITY PROTEIN: uncharacterized protein ACNS7B_020474 [Menidia menidia]
MTAGRLLAVVDAQDIQTWCSLLGTCRGKGRAGSWFQEHIQSGGPALRWSMERCHHRCHVLDKEAPITGEREGLKPNVNGNGSKQRIYWWEKKTLQDMLQENGVVHFSRHMYQRLQEGWSCKEQQLRAWLRKETDVGDTQGKKQNTAKTKLKVSPEQNHRYRQRSRNEARG